VVEDQSSGSHGERLLRSAISLYLPPPPAHQ